MLYATTRSKVDTHTAQRALAEERAPDGGFYVPAAVPLYSREALEALLQEPAGEIVARVLNDFFGSKLGRLDVEFALSRKFFGLARISHRIVIGELWRNADGSFEELAAGDVHYCPHGGTHSLVNVGEVDLTFHAVVPEHGVASAK